jgi:hypothetical protein
MSYKIECNPESHEIYIRDNDGNIVHHSHTIEQQRVALAFALEELSAERERRAELEANIIKLCGPYTVNDIDEFLNSCCCEKCGVSILDEADKFGCILCSECSTESAAREDGE